MLKKLWRARLTTQKPAKPVPEDSKWHVFYSFESLNSYGLNERGVHRAELESEKAAKAFVEEQQNKTYSSSPLASTKFILEYVIHGSLVKPTIETVEIIQKSTEQKRTW